MKYKTQSNNLESLLNPQHQNSYQSRVWGKSDRVKQNHRHHTYNQQFLQGKKNPTVKICGMRKEGGFPQLILC